MPDLSEDRESIRKLKARYFRFLDTKQWDAFASLFTDDARMENGPADSAPVVGATAIAEYVSSSVAALVTVHHGHTPEITFAGVDEAHGVWPMFDSLRGPDGFAMDGWGHYHETYRRDGDGTWRIAATRLTRLRVESSNPDVTRSLWPDAPDWIVESD